MSPFIRYNDMSIIIKTQEQINGIKESCKLASSTLDYITPYVKAGVSTAELDLIIEEYITKNKALPAPKGYKVGKHVYPKATCISVNEVVCHGIPDDTKLKDGDILNIDVTTILNGYYGDTSRMFAVGNISKKAKELIDITERALYIGIEAVKPGRRFGDIGYAIAKYVLRKGYSIVEEFCGHGVGIEFHEPPLIQHIANPKTGDVIKPNMIFTIEPMINRGVRDIVISESNYWTVSTKDKSLSAQWEHTVLVTQNGREILTK